MHQVERRKDVHPLVQSVTHSVFTEAGSVEFLPDQSWDITFIRNRQGTFVLRTGLTLKTYWQIVRARRAIVLLGEGTPAAEVAFALGNADQPHLIRSLRAFMGTTPGRVARAPEDNFSAAG